MGWRIQRAFSDVCKQPGSEVEYVTVLGRIHAKNGMYAPPVVLRVLLIVPPLTCCHRNPIIVLEARVVSLPGAGLSRRSFLSGSGGLLGALAIALRSDAARAS